MGKNLMLVITSAALAAGCASPVPVAQNFPLSHQKVARTAHHWDVVADDVVEQTTSTMKGFPSLDGRPVYVTPPAVNTVFDAAFRDFLLNRMLTHGVTVNVCPVKQTVGFAQAPAVQVNYSTRVIQHSANMSLYEPGALTALTSGVLAWHEIALHASDPWIGAASVGTAALVDVWLGHAALATRTEIIVTTTIVENNHFLMRRSDVYYVPEADANLFTDRATRTDDCPGAATNSAQREIDQEKQALTAKLDKLVRFNPDWHGRVYSEKDFGLDGPVFVER
jgi:hypothetical protein